ncbi:unnamed protein product [Lactuca virosa]|uniref:Uncharacterized protein n=1 Tax=Lactuca virosa TaxID=75947 RepID=A0AAU9MZA6_9ASTR|nr:unnamed protein product [Lactuca virosa]
MDSTSQVEYLTIEVNHTCSFVPKPIVYFNPVKVVVSINVDFRSMSFMEFISYVKKLVKDGRITVYCCLPQRSMRDGLRAFEYENDYINAVEYANLLDYHVLFDAEVGEGHRDVVEVGGDGEVGEGYGAHKDVGGDVKVGEEHGVAEDGGEGHACVADLEVGDEQVDDIEVGDVGGVIDLVNIGNRHLVAPTLKGESVVLLRGTQNLG